MEWILLAAVCVAVVVLFISNGRMRGDVDRLLQENQLQTANLTRLERLYESLLASRHVAPIATTAPFSPGAIVETPPTPVAPLVVEPPPMVVERPTVAEAPMPPTEPVAAMEPAKPAEPAQPAAPRADAPLGDIPPTLAAAASPPPQESQPSAKRFEWERLVGVQLPIWIGALALCVAGYFFVSYAIESGFFTPEFRVLAALLAGFGFLGAAEFIRQRLKTGNAANIAAALASAAIATFYATAYIASAVYDIVPDVFGFIAMAVVTAFAIVIALVYGQAVAILGILGGYLTPAFFASETPSPVVFFSYLSALHIAAFAVIRLKGWWHVGYIALIGPLAWTLLSSTFAASEANPYPIIVFLVLLPIVAGIASSNAWRDDATPVSLLGSKTLWIGRALPGAMAVASLGFLALIKGGDGALPYWQGLIVLSVLAVAASFARPTSLGYVMFPPMVASVIALLTWRNADTGAIAIMTAILAVVFVFGALDQFRRFRRPMLWATTLSVVTVAFFLVALFKVTGGWEQALAQKHFWAAAALLIAAALIALLWNFGPRVADEIELSRVYAVLAAAVTTFVSLAVVLELDPTLFPAASALAVLGLAGVYSRVPVRGLRVLAAVYAVIYGVLLVGAGGGIARLNPTLAYALPKSIDDAPWVLLVLPGLAFIAASSLFRRHPPEKGVDILSEVLDIAAVLLLGLGIVYVAAPGFLQDPLVDIYVTAARIAGPETLLAALAVYLGMRVQRRSLYIAGLILAGLVALSMLVTVLLPIYQFWPTLNVPAWAIFSIAWLTLGLPGLVFAGIGRYVRQNESDIRFAHYGRALSVFAVVTLFTWMLVEIRRAYHPELLQGTTGSAEFYTYSAGMLIFGVALLLLGVMIQNRGARALSLVFVLAATVKVFLFDTASLEGLWRVLSFLGMGISFLGISWAYARYVFGIGRIRPPDITPPVATPAI